MEQSSKAWKGDWKSWKSKGESKLQNCLGQPEFSEESKISEETCCHSESSERPSANAIGKNSLEVNNQENKKKGRKTTV